jgi:hypothetical protein
VSASNQLVYFRDGETKIRSLSPNGRTADVTIVPGGPTTVSFFSVSPDDQRIAVLVEDLRSGTGIDEKLYVEDLKGGGHHADIYSTTTPKDSRGQTLWPMGWHQGQLLLAVLPACSDRVADLSPSEWQVVDPSTGMREVAITGPCADGRPGVLSRWPSPAGVACMSFGSGTSLYDWTGKSIAGFQLAAPNANDAQSGFSPSGRRYFVSSETYRPACNGGEPPSTCAYEVGQTQPHAVDGHAACLWIDEGTLLAPDAVILFSSGTATSLSARGLCAGRFPGGL